MRRLVFAARHLPVFRHLSFPGAHMRKLSKSLVRELPGAAVFIVFVVIGLLLTSQRANAQAAYFYQGNEFTPAQGSVTPTFPNVTATLLLDSWLAPNQQGVGLPPGFRLLLKVGPLILDTNDQQFVIGGGVVSTDAQGMIVAPWGLELSKRFPAGPGQPPGSPPLICTKAGVPLFPCGSERSPVESLDAFWLFRDNPVTAKVENDPGHWSYPAALIVSLILTRFQLGQLPDVGNSFVSQLQAVANDITSQNGQACEDLNAFAHHVKAQRGKKLTAAQADSILDAVARIMTVPLCGS
jgi:hypothetical protein